ncbi:beta-galactosidase [Paenibacillus aurantiacus]|uniref:Beta-galactosidase n=1 Tax=Paenibacillus aurantiacus TaxID=1936118 RepID=A0ABV5L0I0_9BACL
MRGPIRRTSILFLSLLLLSLSFGFMGVPPAHAEETDSGYLPDWSFYASGAPQTVYSLDTATFHDGGGSLKLTSASSRAPNVYLTGFQTVAVKPATSYTVSAWVKGSNAASGMWFGGGASWNVRQALPSGTFDWQLLEKTFTTGAEETSFTFRFLIENTAEAVWLDSFSLKETGTGANLLKNAGFDARAGVTLMDGFETLAAWSGTVGPAGAVTAIQSPEHTEGQSSAQVKYQKAPDRGEWLSYKRSIDPPANMSAATALLLDVYPLSQTASVREPLGLKLIAQGSTVLDQRLNRLIAGQWNTIRVNLPASAPRDQVIQASLNVNAGSAEMEGRTQVEYRFDNLRIVTPVNDQQVGTVEPVTASPAPGTIPPNTSITLATGTAEAEIVYTMDGSDPNQSGSASVYGGPVSMLSSSTVKAFARKTGWQPSPVSEFAYVVEDDGPGPGETILDWASFKDSLGARKEIPLIKADGIVIDGNLDEWGPYTSMSLPANDEQVVLSGWEGASDLSANVHVAYDENYFYWAAKVTDNVHFPVKDSIMWRGDSVQLAFGLNDVYGPDYGFNFMDGQTQIWSWNPGNAEFGKDHIDFKASTTPEGDTVYEARMPWKTIYSEAPATNDIPFSILINDNDGSARRGWIEWTPGIGKAKDPTQFGILEKVGELDDWNFWLESAKGAQVDDSVDYTMYIPNYSDDPVVLNLTSAKLGLQDTLTIPPHSVMEKKGTMSFGEAGVQTADFKLQDPSGKSKERIVSVNVYLGPAETLAQYDALQARMPALESLLAQAKGQGISTDYEQINVTILKDFLVYGRGDVENGRLSRAGYVIRSLEALYQEAETNLQAYLAGESEAFAAPRYTTGRPTIDGTSFIANTKVRNTGAEETRPVFFNGYGHFAQVRKDIAKFQDLGTNMIQVEIGPRNVILSKDNYLNQYRINKSGGVNAEAALDDSTTHAGPYSLKITNASPRAANTFLNLWQTVTVKPNTTYTVKAWAKGSNAKDVWFPGGAGWKLRVKFPNGTYDWQEVSGEYTTGPTETSFQFMILSENTGTIWIDDLSMKEHGSDTNLLANPGFDDRGLDVPGQEYLVSPAQLDSDIKVVLQNAAANNISVNLLVSPHYFPDWAIKKWPDLQYSNNGFIQYNINHPIARAMMRDYLRLVASELKDYPALHSITISNEPVFQTNQGTTFLGDWHQYLQEQYGDIASLNAVYGTSHQSFADVTMPFGLEPTVRGYDWVRFNQKVFTEWHQFLADTIHEVAPDIPVHAKVMAEMRASLSRGIDAEEFAEMSQLNGNDNWNYLGEGAGGFRDEMSYYDLQQSFKEAPVFNSEHHVIADGDSRYVAKQADHVRSVLWQGAIHGKSASTIWIWERTYQETNSAEGSILHRPDAVAAVGRTNLDLNRLSREVTALQKQKARVALLYSEPSLVYSEMYENVLLKGYEALSATGIKVGFVSEKQAAAGKLADYDLLIVPEATNVAPATLTAIKQFADQDGSVVIIGSESLRFDERLQPLSETERTALFSQATVVPSTDVTAMQLRNDLYPLLHEKEIIEATLVDAESGEPVENVEWRSANDQGGMLLNVVNYGNLPKKVRIELEGGTALGAVDLITGEQFADDTIELKSLTPYLFRLQAGPQIQLEIEGVVAGGDYTDTVTPVLRTNPEDGLRNVELLLDGKAFLTGTPVTARGQHTLEARAVDRKGKVLKKTVSFTLYHSMNISVASGEGEYSDTVPLALEARTAEGTPAAGRTVKMSVNGGADIVATTGEDGKAVVPYKVELDIGETAEQQEYVVAARMDQDAGAFYRGGEATANLVIKREKAQLRYTGELVAEQGEKVTLAAVVTDEQDDSPGSIEGVPVKFAVGELRSDGTVVPVQLPETETVYRTGNSGEASVEVSLPVGVYEVKADLGANGRFSGSGTTTIVGVRGPGQVNVVAAGFVDTPSTASDAEAKGVNRKTHLKVSVISAGGKINGEIKLKETPSGADLQGSSVEWAIRKGDEVFVKARVVDPAGTDYVMLFVAKLRAGKAETAIMPLPISPPPSSQAQEAGAADELARNGIPVGRSGVSSIAAGEMSALSEESPPAATEPSGGEEQPGTPPAGGEEPSGGQKPPASPETPEAPDTQAGGQQGPLVTVLVWKADGGPNDLIIRYVSLPLTGAIVMK